MNKPNNSWIKDWKIGENPSRENELGKDLVSIFKRFWIDCKLDSKSKSTMNRYTGALHCLGGYLVEKGIYNEINFSALELINEYITKHEGPLVHYDNEDWQDELDMVCRKLYKHINK
jgi:hypothetical protein